MIIFHTRKTCSVEAENTGPLTPPFLIAEEPASCLERF
jgi:hypothetical protein